MEFETPGIRLLGRYYYFLPALAVCGVAAWLASYAGAVLFYFSHALFGWAAFAALRADDATSARRAAASRFPATLLLLFGFGLVGALLLGVPVALSVSQPGWLSWGVLSVCILIFFSGGTRFWPAPALMYAASSAELGSGAFERAARATRLGLKLTSGHLHRTLEGAPLFIALGLLIVVPFVLVLAGQGPSSPGYWWILGFAFLLVAPLIHVFLLDEVSSLLKELSPQSGTSGDGREEDGVKMVQAARRGLLTDLQQLHAAGSPIDEPMGQTTPLMAAMRAPTAQQGEIVGFLLAGGASLDAVDEKGWTPLHHAAAHATRETVSALVTAGAELEAEDNEHLTPLGVACARARWGNAARLMEAGAEVNPRGVAPIHCAAGADGDDPAGVDLLIANGAEVSVRGKLGRTALMAAAMKGNSLIARALLKSGAKVNAQDDFGNTALMEAARAGANRVLDELSHWNPETEHRDKPGRTALLVAVSSRRADEDTVRLLLAMGAERTVKNREGREAGELAAAAGRWRIARALGVDVPLPEPPAAKAAPPPEPAEPEDNRVIDLKTFQTDEDLAWAERQFTQRSRTQLDAAGSESANRSGTSEEDEETEARPEAEVSVEPVEQPAAEATAEQPHEPEQVSEPLQHREEALAESLQEGDVSGDLDSVAEIDFDPEADVPQQAELPMPTEPESEPRDEKTAGYQTLLKAAVRDDLEQMQLVLDHEEEAPEWWFTSAFLNAVAAGRGIAPLWLLDHGLNANARSEGGTPLLSCLAQQPPPNLEVLEKLLDRGARVDGQPLLLHWLCGKADHQHGVASELETEDEVRLSKLVSRMIDSGADPAMEDESGNVPLHWAVRYRHPGLVEALLDRGAPVDPRNGSTATPLMMAVTDGRTGVVRVLVKHGADPKANNEKGNSAMSIALERQDKTLTKLLMSSKPPQREPEPRESDPAALVDAAAEGNLGRVKLLLTRGMDIDFCDDQGCSALLRAAGGGHADVVSALLHAGADYRLASKNRTTPLGAAVLGGHLEVAKLLCDRGVDADQPQQYGITPLMLAAARWQPRMVVALIGYDADPNARDETECTPLMAAVQNALQAADIEAGVSTVKMLLKAGADVNAVNDEGQSALMLLLGVRARAREDLPEE
ncbi:MAG: ankyrin repeat domain-containing protein, partial [Xanthomonadales bacterium]|nr:ankyrin repeat domain-containing protein [Xanthomonadales bacterium]